MTAKHGLDCDGTAVRALPHIPAMQICRSTLLARCTMVRRLNTADLPMDQTTKPPTTAFTRAGRKAWPLLVLTTLFWGGNVVAARWASGEISPALLVGLRWIIVSFFVLAYAGPRIFEVLKSLRPHAGFLFVAGAIGFTVSNLTLYEGARFTSGINVAIIQGVMPVIVLAGARILWGTRIGPVRGVGVAMTIAGILLIACEGDVARLARMHFNFGDLIVVTGTATYALYTLALRKRPELSSFAFFVGVSLAAAITSVPAIVVEWMLGGSVLPGWKGVGILLYVAIFVSILGQLFWIRAVELIGPGRAGLFQNLVPVIGAILAVVVLREDFHWYHAMSLVLVLGGLMLSEWVGRARAVR